MRFKRYNHSQTEKKWRAFWLKKRIYEPDFSVRQAQDKKPFYNLMMFPYPSAEGLHIGGMRTFTGVDIYGRMKRMQGFDVFEPIGLDGFGIHSENYALKAGKHPMKHARDSEKNFYRQLSMMGNGFAWKERLETYDPDYYKWTQWIFVQMFKRGLAYRKKSAVNWCPSCKTVLADEQVVQKSKVKSQKSRLQVKIQNEKDDENETEIQVGVCERCETPVIKKELEQWFFRITNYAERLLKNLDKIDWSEKVKIAQRNWIGRSEGALIKFPVAGSLFPIEVFTTRPDTLFGATYLVSSPEHSVIENLKLKIRNWREVEDYIKKAKNKSDEERIAEGKDKTGVELEGIKAINPINKEEIPVFVADYVLGGVGTGAIMAVPAHDQRDFEFAKKFKLPIRVVISLPEKRNEIQDELERVVEKIIGFSEKTKNNFFFSGGFANYIYNGSWYRNHKDIDICVPEKSFKAWCDFFELKGFSRYKNPPDDKRDYSKYSLYIKEYNNHNIEVDIWIVGEDDKGELCDYEWGRPDAWGLKKDAIHRKTFRNHIVNYLSPEGVAKLKFRNGPQDKIDKVFAEKEVYVGLGRLVNSGRFSGKDSEKAKWEITKFVGGQRRVQYRLRDWLLSRQRYWGSPIPMIFCEVCAAKGLGEQKEMFGWYAVPEKNLPVKLPYVKNFRPTGTAQSPLATVEKFYKVRCPKCKAWARRETDVSDTFLDSAWYYIGYLMTFGNWKLEIGNSAFAKLTRRWLPVDMYIGGAEHSVLHLLYSRFLAMAFHDWKMTNFDEPFTVFRAHGLITKDGAKMSKSKGNVVNPDNYVKTYGADVMRIYLAFLSPLTQDGDFRDGGIRGITRFLERVWQFVNAKFPPSPMLRRTSKIQNDSVRRLLHKTIKKVTEDIENLQYNTAISAMMVLFNKFEAEREVVGIEDVKIFLKLLAPFAPHLAEELWRSLPGKKETESIHISKWPEYDPKLIKEDIFELIIQINGKVRSTVKAKIGLSEKEAIEVSLKQPNIQKNIASQSYKKAIYVPNRLINFVL